jgi:hypothetical protein
MKIQLVAFFIFILFSGLAQAGDDRVIILYPEEGHNNQNQITQALKDYDIVYLSAGVYEVDGPTYIGSNKILFGDPNAIIRVWSGSSQWWGLSNGIIMGEFTGSPLHDIAIVGFQIDGNCDELPASYANYVAPGGSGHHNTERCIDLRGWSDPEKGFMQNISIHDMQIYDAFSDGIRVAYADDVLIYNNFISNCQHEGVYFVCVRYGLIKNCEIAGITSDCVRFDNCQNTRICYSYIFSYTGENNNGEYMGGHQGIQAGNQGRSFNSGSTQPLPTKNIEIDHNIFSGDKRMNIWLDASGKGYENIYVHDNEFQDGEELETNGISVDGLDIEDVDFNHLPPKEMSKKVFKQFDIKNPEFSEDGYVEQGDISAVKDWEKKGKYTQAYIFLAGYDGQIYFNDKTYIPAPASECAIIKYDTRNLASNENGQTSELTLSDAKDGSLKASLKVKTKWKEKAYKTQKILGITLKVPYWKKKSETVTFTKNYPAPPQFPKLGSGLFNVTVEYYNNSYNPHTLVTVRENQNETKQGELVTFIEYKYQNSTAKEFRQIGYVISESSGYKKTNFRSTNTWKFSGEALSHSSRQLYIEGPLNLNSLEIIIHTPYQQTKVTDISYSEIKESPDDFFEKMKQLFWVILFFAPFLYSLSSEFKIVFGRFRG